ncbi:MAG: response regulator [Scytolyngbya sp. HA4215-MV1]|jgi:chemotaxis family two-component system response regulator PixG|nr:response regulator [Scytolyngbya sp. HA4215-MV1]
MATEITVITKLAHDLLVLQQQQSTGELVITPAHSPAVQWRLYFYLGRLVYATGGSHRVRRWYRSIRQYCPDLLNHPEFLTMPPTEEPWEMYRLNYAVRQGWVTTPQAKAIIQSSVQEVIFAFVDPIAPKTEWFPGKFIAQPSVFLSIDQILQDIQDLRAQWLTGSLAHLQELFPCFSPDLAPNVRYPEHLKQQVSNGVYYSLTRLMQGKKTLWDVAIHLKKPLPALLRSLLPLLRQGLIELQSIPDLPNPYGEVGLPVQHARATKGLIACIDDSPVIGQIMEQLLTPYGYEVLTILNPLQGIATLLERKPNLIFLDLVMPNTNGYELCSFLRKTSAFQNTPIVILTGHDGVIDRVRAKLVGASEFLSKPPEPNKVLQVLERYLSVSQPENMLLSTRFATT